MILFWLQIFNELISEMNVNKTGQPLSLHRKKSVSFRDRNLLQIFQISLQTLQQLLSGAMGTLEPQQDVRLREQCLKLALGCLSYDFIGTSVDESTEDVGTVQVRMTVLYMVYCASHPEDAGTWHATHLHCFAFRTQLFYLFICFPFCFPLGISTQSYNWCMLVGRFLAIGAGS